MNPWWGNPYSDSSLFAKEMFDTYSYDTTCYGITEDIPKAEMVFVPYRHNWLLHHDPGLLAECVRVAQESGKALLIDGTGDIEIPLVHPNVYILRYGGYRFLPESNAIHIPLTVDDLLERCQGGKLNLRQKSTGAPVVGFAGWASLTPRQYARTVVKELGIRMRAFMDSRYKTQTKGVLWRKRAIELLRKSSSVRLNLRARTSFSGSSKTAVGNMQQLREEMVETLLASDYGLDVKGDANNSARLFEILSLGRIPIIIDTERNLPFSDIVDYDSFALRINYRDIAELPKRIAEFHSSLSPEKFQTMQKNARQAFLQYFRIDAVMEHLVRELREKISNT
jgi:glycosyltransferase involved in cell wall biosynthesis